MIQYKGSLGIFGAWYAEPITALTHQGYWLHGGIGIRLLFAVACRSKAAAAETTIGKLASLLGLPSTQANRSAISEWDLARIIISPLLAPFSPASPACNQPHEALPSAGPPSTGAASEGMPSEGPSAEALPSQAQQEAEVLATATETEEQAEWPADTVTVCHGALWQIEGCDVGHAQIKEIRQGDDPLNIGMLLPLQAFPSLATVTINAVFERSPVLDVIQHLRRHGQWGMLATSSLAIAILGISQHNLIGFVFQHHT